MIEKMIGMDELPLPVKLIVAFVIVLALIAIVLWLIRRLAGSNVGAAPARGRQPRLAVIDAAAVDSRRRLVLIRRDNVEHLIMIGGPTDVVVEQNIVRAVPVATPREGQIPRTAEQAAASRPAPEPALRGSIEPPPRGAPERQRMPPPPPSRAPRVEPIRPMPAERPRPQPVQIEPEPAPVEVHPAPPTADANLADMAQKLEAALRRPQPLKRPESAPPETPTVLFETTPPTAPEQDANGASRMPAATSSSSPAAAPDSKPAPQDSAPKSVFDSLEEEMASLLSKPPAKP
jgi:flagellar biogenesis protein FliO